MKNVLHKDFYECNRSDATDCHDHRQRFDNTIKASHKHDYKPVRRECYFLSNIEAWEKYKKSNRSLRNPKFWLRTAFAVSTVTEALLHGFDSVAKLAGSKSEWPTIVAAGLMSFGDFIDHNFTMKSALF